MEDEAEKRALNEAPHVVALDDAVQVGAKRKRDEGGLGEHMGAGKQRRKYSRRVVVSLDYRMHLLDSLIEFSQKHGGRLPAMGKAGIDSWSFISRSAHSKLKAADATASDPVLSPDQARNFWNNLRARMKSGKGDAQEKRLLEPRYNKLRTMRTNYVEGKGDGLDLDGVDGYAEDEIDEVEGPVAAAAVAAAAAAADLHHDEHHHVSAGDVVSVADDGATIELRGGVGSGSASLAPPSHAHSKAVVGSGGRKSGAGSIATSPGGAVSGSGGGGGGGGSSSGGVGSGGGGSGGHIGGGGSGSSSSSSSGGGGGGGVGGGGLGTIGAGGAASIDAATLRAVLSRLAHLETTVEKIADRMELARLNSEALSQRAETQRERILQALLAISEIARGALPR